MPIDSHTLVIFIPVVIVLVTTPGPNTLYLVATGLSYGPLAAVYAAIGMLLATLCHVILTATGVSSLIAASQPAFDTMRLAGAAYLLWLAYDNFRSRHVDYVKVQNKPLAVDQLRKGFITNLLNPKSIVFCLLFLPQFVSLDHGGVLFQILALGTILIVIGFCSDMIFAISSGTIARYIQGSSSILIIQKWLLSFVFAALALRLLMLNHTT